MFEYIATFFDYPDKIEYPDKKFLEEHVAPYIFHNLIKTSTTTQLEESFKASSTNSLLFTTFIRTCLQTDIENTIIISQYKKFLDEKNENLFELIFNNVSQNIKKSISLVDSIYDNLDEKYYPILSGLLCGIFYCDCSQGIKIAEKIIIKDNLHPLLINSISRIKSQEEEVLIQIFYLLKRCNSEEGSLIQKTNAYFQIQDKIEFNSDIKQKFITEIIILSEVESQNTLFVILNNLSHINLGEDNSLLLLFKVIRNKSFSKSHLTPNGNNIRLFDWAVKNSIKSTKNHFELLEHFVKYSSERFNISYLEFSIRDCYLSNQDNYLNYILTLLTSKIGKDRFLGHYLLEYIIELNPRTKFGDKILNLSNEKQLFLVLSISIPTSLKFTSLFNLIIPLLNSQFELVQETVINYVLSKYIHYTNVSESIDKYLEAGDIKDYLKENLYKIENYKKQVNEKKDALLEFDIRNQFPQYYTLYNKLFKKKMGILAKEAQKDSLINKLGINRINLLKGGGFRMEGSKEITPLAHLQSSIQISMASFINSDEDDYYTNIFFSQNWENQNDWQIWLTRF